MQVAIWDHRVADGINPKHGTPTLPMPAFAGAGQSNMWLTLEGCQSRNSGVRTRCTAFPTCDFRFGHSLISNGPT